MPSKRKNFKDVLYELADSSSLHGVSKITSSRHLPVKILWCVLFLAAFALLVRQMVDLFSTFYSHPIQTSISVKYGPLKLPAVTICNMNAIRFSALSLSPKLLNLAFYVSPLSPTVKREKIYLTPPAATSFNTSINETFASKNSLPVPAENSSNGQQFISPTPLQDLQETSEINQDSSTTSSSSDINDTDIELQKEVSWSMLENIRLEIKDTLLKKKILAKRDKWSDRIMKMMRYLKQENETTLKRFLDPEYGLKITLNVEIDEYVDTFITSPGIKVVLHEPGSLPLPSEEGFMLNPATQTNVGLKMVSINRLGQPYGECTEGLEFERKYKIKYSVPFLYEKSMKTISMISSIMTVSENNICVNKQDILFNDDHVTCHCENSCSEIMYSTTMSSRRWPGVNLLNELMNDVCQDHKLLYSMSIPCAQVETGYVDQERYSQNFLQLLVYFDDLNYESITQEPMYEHVRFLSDIGGAFGLFLGASVLSFVEFLQLLMEICLYLYHEGKAKVSSKISDVMMAHTVIAAFKSKASDTNTRNEASP